MWPARRPRGRSYVPARAYSSPARGDTPQRPEKGSEQMSKDRTTAEPRRGRQNGKGAADRDAPVPIAERLLLSEPEVAALCGV